MARLNIAMLGEQAQEQQEINSEIEVMGNQVEDSLQQAQQAQVEIDQINGAAIQAQQAGEDLEKEAQAAEQAKELSTSQQQAALESIQRNVKNILKDIGLFSSPSFAMESRKGDSKVALEGVAQDVKGFIKKIWDMLKIAWSKMMEVIGNFLKEIFVGAKRLKKRAEDVVKETKKFKGRALPANTKYEAPQSVKDFMRLKSMPIPPDKVALALGKQSEINHEMIKDIVGKDAISQYKSSLSTIQSEMEKFYNFTNNEIADEEKLAKAAKDFFEPIRKKLKSESGNKTFISDRQINVDEHTLRVEVGKYVGYKELTEKHDPLSIDEIVKVCEVAIEQMDNYDDLEQNLNNIKSVAKEINDEAEKLTNPNDETPWLIRKTTTIFVSGVVKHLMSLIKDGCTKIQMIDMQLNKAAVDWAASSLKLYNNDRPSLDNKANLLLGKPS